MSWFRRKDKGLRAIQKRDLPDGLWTKCEGCGEIIYRQEIRRSHSVCRKCGFHFRITGADYIELLLDQDTFQEIDQDLKPTDPLHFREPVDYAQKLLQSQAKTGLTDAAMTGVGKIGGMPVVLGLLDFRFMGGSMASVVGEKVARAARRALEDHTPFVMVSGSGGARMQEGMLSLMQMVKTSASLACLAEAALPYVSILTNPTTGGVTASFASLGDVNLAEPGALIGFAGPRVIAQTINQELPPGFQRAEFLLEHGMVDLVVPRPELRTVLMRILRFLSTDFNPAAAPIPLPRRDGARWSDESASSWGEGPI